MNRTVYLNPLQCIGHTLSLIIVKYHGEKKVRQCTGLSCHIYILLMLKTKSFQSFPNIYEYFSVFIIEIIQQLLLTIEYNMTWRKDKKELSNAIWCMLIIHLSNYIHLNYLFNYHKATISYINNNNKALSH